MKRLLIANASSIFAKELRAELFSKGLDTYLLDFESLRLFDDKNSEIKKYANRFSKYENIPKISMLMRMLIIKELLREHGFDVINIHYSRWYYLIILKELARSKLIVTFYGSDFYRVSDKIKNIQKPLYKKADALTFTNPLTKESFLEYYGDFESKSFVCRFGLKTLDYIDKNRDKDKAEIKKELGYDETKIIVTCGYNSSKAQQHKKIIEHILKLPNDMLKKVQFIFPLTYGDMPYKEEVRSILKSTDLDYIILEDYLYEDNNAYIKPASDIMINILQSDSFSGSMQEFLYAGNVVITGSWLPYGVFDKEGIKYLKIDKSDDLSDKLMQIVQNLEVYKKGLDTNRDIIYNLSSWKSNIQNWIDIYED